MRLYHGTTELAARDAAQRGLLPRLLSKTTNWRHTVQSNAKAVYLTNVYSVYFAVQAANELDAVGQRLAIIEVETDRLDQTKLVPDEDMLEYATRGVDDLPAHWSMNKRVRHYRSRMHQYAGKFTMSLDAMGTCAHLGIIPPSAFTRIAYVDYNAAAGAVWIGMNASVSARNYKFMAAQHRAVTNWIFDDADWALTTEEEFFNGDAIAKLRAFPHKGVEIQEFSDGCTN